MATYTRFDINSSLIGLYHDVDNPHFGPVSTIYHYNGKRPEAYFAECFDSEKARALADRFAPDEPVGGV